MKAISLAALLFAIAAPAQAGPWKYIREHKRFFEMEATNLGAAGFHAYELHRCRQRRLERCEEGYGSAWGAFGFEAGLTTIALPAAAEGCWHDSGNKLCYALGYSGSVAQFGQGLHELYVGDENKNASKPDLSDVVILHP